MKFAILLSLMAFAGAAQAKEAFHQCKDIQILNLTALKNGKAPKIPVANSGMTIFDDKSASVVLEGKEQARTAQEMVGGSHELSMLATAIISTTGKAIVIEDIKSVKAWTLLPGDGKANPAGDVVNYMEVRMMTGEVKVLVMVQDMTGICDTVVAKIDPKPAVDPKK